MLEQKKEPGGVGRLPPLPSNTVVVTAPTWQVTDVDSALAFDLAMESLTQASLIAVDTETFGYQTGHVGAPTPESVGTLGLLQIGFPAEKSTFLLDPFALDRSGIDWVGALRPLIESSNPQKIIHNALFERAVFAGRGITLDAGVIDTCALARVLMPKLEGSYPGLKRASLQALAAALLGQTIGKEEQTSDWSRRPLTERQRDYAALDVELATDLFTVLERVASFHGIDPRAIDWRTSVHRR